MVDEHVLANYMNTFVGFGSYSADFWFVGMEQDGGHDVAELERRLNAWQSMRCEEVVDLPTYLAAIGEERWSGARAAIQPTLGKMIRIVLSARGVTPSAAAIRSHQVERLGRSGDETLLTELSPWPASRSATGCILKSPASPISRAVKPTGPRCRCERRSCATGSIAAPPGRHLVRVVICGGLGGARRSSARGTAGSAAGDPARSPGQDDMRRVPPSNQLRDHERLFRADWRDAPPPPPLAHSVQRWNFLRVCNSPQATDRRL